MLPTLLLALAAHATDPQQALQQALDEIASAEDLLDSAGQPAVQREVRRKLDHAQALLRDLEREGLVVTPATAVTVNGGGLTISVNDPSTDELMPPPSAELGPQPMSPERFARLRRGIDDESFSSGKLGLLGEATATDWFTSAQARDLMSVFSFGSDKVEAGAILFPRVIDPENWTIVYSVLDFDSEKKELRRRVGR